MHADQRAGFPLVPHGPDGGRSRRAGRAGEKPAGKDVPGAHGGQPDRRPLVTNFIEYRFLFL